MKTDPQQRSPQVDRQIDTIQRSIRSFIFSLIGLIPVAGIPFTLAAVVQSRKAALAAGSDWNPAGGYLKASKLLVPVSFLVSLGFLVLVCGIIPALWRDMNSCASGST